VDGARLFTRADDPDMRHLLGNGELAHEADGAFGVHPQGIDAGMAEA
jgi:hypothetical protein